MLQDLEWGWGCQAPKREEKTSLCQRMNEITGVVCGGVQSAGHNALGGGMKQKCIWSLSKLLQPWNSRSDGVSFVIPNEPLLIAPEFKLRGDTGRVPRWP